jgi:hypothetical protein
VPAGAESPQGAAPGSPSATAPSESPQETTAAPAATDASKPQG